MALVSTFRWASRRYGPYDVNEGIKSSFSTDALSDCCLNVMCCVRLFHVVDTKDWL
jgi:hypothetical protein